MSIEKIIEKLKKADAKFKVHEVPEEVGISVDEHIEAFGLDYSDGGATLIFSTGKGFIALIRRDDTKVDNKKLRKAVESNKLRMASLQEISEMGFEPGMVSPLMLPEGVEVFIDKKVLEKETVRVGSMADRQSLEVSTEDLSRVTEAREVDVTDLNLERTGSKKLRFLSGITPSSSKGLHLGNYLGAVKPHVELQERGEAFYFIADYHALNTVRDPKEFAQNTYETYLDYLALGIDLERTVFFLESHVQGIFELTEILNNSVTMAQMKRMHAYKDKLQDPDVDIDSINMGLFNYPILMAADILAFAPDVIPVGEDQSQHVEIARDIAKSFNHKYGQVLKVPELLIKKEVARLTGTDGDRKMSKSLGNDLTIFASEEDLKEQIMGITTDPGRIHKDDPGDPEKNIIFTYLELMNFNPDKLKEYRDRYIKGTIGDVELKLEFYEFFLDYFSEFREKRAGLSQDREEIIKMMHQQASKANKVSSEVLSRVRKSIGAIYLEE